MITQIFPSLGPCATNGYIAISATTKEAVVIDAPSESFALISAYLEQHQLLPKLLLLTHSHWDHIVDAKLWKDHYGTSIAIHSLDVSNLHKPGTDLLPCPFSIPPLREDILLEEGSIVEVGDLVFQVIHTPGHTPGSICFYEKEKGILFSGDTLFKKSIGNLSFPTSQPHLMQESLNKFLSLPPQVRVYPGHGQSTTIQEEATWIPNAKKIFRF
jgi:hydroxyacylglutathione hydrolase